MLLWVKSHLLEMWKKLWIVQNGRSVWARSSFWRK